MAIEVTCRCGQRFAAPAEYAGRQTPCPICGQTLQIPAPQNPSLQILAPRPPATSVYPVVVSCACGSRFQTTSNFAGRQVACPNCSQQLTIPQTPSPPPIPGGDSLWDDLRPAGTNSRAQTAFLGAAGGATLAPAPQQPRRKQGHNYLPNEANWELYYSLPLAAALLIMGLVVFVMSLFSMQTAFASAEWSSTTATITAADLVERRVRRRLVYEARLKYDYTVDGKSYTGTRVSISGATGTSLTGEQVVAKYPVGSKPTCYYDPSSPADSVLEKGTNAYTFVIPLLGLGIAICGGVWSFRCGMTLRHRFS
jgi:hypothetical protein